MWIPPAPVIGILMVTLGTLLFSAKSIVIQWLFGFGVSVEQLLLMRMMVSFPFYLILGGLPIRHMRRRGKRLPSLSQCLGMIVAGMLCYHAAAYLDMWALQRITAGLERTILFSYPLMVAIIQHFRGDKLKALQWASLGLAYVGIWLFYYEDHQIFGDVIFWGAIAVVLAAALTSYYVLASQHYTRQIHSDLFTSVAMSVTALSISTHVGVFAPSFTLVLSLPIIMRVFVLAVCCTVLASVLLNRGIAVSGAVYGSIAGMLGPLITVLLSGAVLGAPITSRHGLAPALVIVGVVGVQWLGRRASS